MNTSPTRWTRLIALCGLATLPMLGAVGCSISDSLSDSSDSSSDSSASSSDSSSPGSKESAYRDDVRDYTTAYVKSGGQVADFDRKVGDLARSRGISNWEDNMATYDGIGRGLGRAQVSQVALDTYVANFAHGNAEKAMVIRKGYDAAKP